MAGYPARFSMSNFIHHKAGTLPCRTLQLEGWQCRQIPLPKTYVLDVGKTQEDLRCLVVACCDASGIPEFVEAALERIAQTTVGPVYADTFPAGVAHAGLRPHVS